MFEHEINSRTFRPPLKVYDGSPWKYAHWKRDGFMVRLEVTTAYEAPQEITPAFTLAGKCPIQWQAWTRRPTDISWELYDLLETIDEIVNGLARTPGSWTLLGELYYPGKPASYIKTGFKNNDRNLRFEAFCFLRAPGYSLAELEQMDLRDSRDLAQVHNVPFVPFWECGQVPTTPLELYNEHDKYLGGIKYLEGYVFKNTQLLGWQKWKKQETIDLIVTGYKMGKGKYRGLVGALLVSTSEGYEVARVSGMTDAERTAISLDLDNTIGRVVECSFQLVGSKGRLRHPQFKGFRDDKTPEQCSVTQNPELEAVWKKAGC